MKSDQPKSSQQRCDQIVTIYKALHKHQNKKIVEDDFQSDDFPLNLPYQDGSCYFAGSLDRSIAKEFNQSYKGGVLEVVIDWIAYKQYFESLEYCYEVKDGRERIEIVIPQKLFPVLNQFSRILKIQWIYGRHRLREH